MNSSFPFISASNGGIYIDILVQPRSSKNQIVGTQDDKLKIKVTAPPVENAANKMCIQLVAEIFNVPKSMVTVTSGVKSRKKRLFIKNVSLSEAIKKLLQVL